MKEILAMEPETLSPQAEEQPSSVLIPAPASPAKATPEKKKPKLIEKEIHRAALSYYFLLGKDRSLAKVAEHFGVKLSYVERWSTIFGWKEKILNLEARSKDDRFKDQVSDLLLLLLGSLTAPDEETGAPTLTGSPKQVAEILKLIMTSFRELKQEAREEAGSDSSGKDSRGKRPPVLVTVNILGLNEK
jgi:hypothetical protein